MINITLNIKDTTTVLTLDEANTLYKELQKLFPNSAAPIRIAPHNPYRPYWYDDNWIEKQNPSIRYTINV